MRQFGGARKPPVPRGYRNCISSLCFVSRRAAQSVPLAIIWPARNGAHESRYDSEVPWPIHVVTMSAAFEATMHLSCPIVVPLNQMRHFSDYLWREYAAAVHRPAQIRQVDAFPYKPLDISASSTAHDASFPIIMRYERQSGAQTVFFAFPPPSFDIPDCSFGYPHSASLHPFPPPLSPLYLTDASGTGRCYYRAWKSIYANYFQMFTRGCWTPSKPTGLL